MSYELMIIALREKKHNLIMRFIDLSLSPSYSFFENKGSL